METKTKNFINQKMVSKNVTKFLCDDWLTDNWLKKRKFRRQWFDSTQHFYSRNLLNHHGCVNAVQFSLDGKYLFSGNSGQWALLMFYSSASTFYLPGNKVSNNNSKPKKDYYGRHETQKTVTPSVSDLQRWQFGVIISGDDGRVLMWELNKLLTNVTKNSSLLTADRAISMKGNHQSNVFAIAVDSHNKRLISGGNDQIFISHDYSTGKTLDITRCTGAVHSISMDPENFQVHAVAAGMGEILLYDSRSPNEPSLSLSLRGRGVLDPFHCVVHHPLMGTLLASAHSSPSVGVQLWDTRWPLEAPFSVSEGKAMSVAWNTSGSLLLCIRNCMPAMLVDPLNIKHRLELDANTYYNGCTLKSCCFAGERDEFILTGSDDFNIYMWKIPDPWPDVPLIKEPHATLTGHRSIVNQVRYNANTQLLASSGVEKMVKVWSAKEFPYERESDREIPDNAKEPRRICCYPASAPPPFIGQNSGIKEDVSMMHYFDKLIVQELSSSPKIPIKSTVKKEELYIKEMNNKKTKLLVIMKKKTPGCSFAHDSDFNSSDSDSGSGSSYDPPSDILFPMYGSSSDEDEEEEPSESRDASENSSNECTSPEPEVVSRRVNNRSRQYRIRPRSGRLFSSWESDASEHDSSSNN